MTAASNHKRSAKEYRCSICNKIFDSTETLNSHVPIGHSQKTHVPMGHSQKTHVPAGVG